MCRRAVFTLPLWRTSQSIRHTRRLSGAAYFGLFEKSSGGAEKSLRSYPVFIPDNRTELTAAVLPGKQNGSTPTPTDLNRPITESC